MKVFPCVDKGKMLILIWCYFRRERVTASGGEVGRLSILGGAEVRSFRLLLNQTRQTSSYFQKFASLHNLFVCDFNRLVPFVVGQEGYVFQDQSGTWMLENLLSQYRT